MTVTPAVVQRALPATGGTDPIFRAGGRLELAPGRRLHASARGGQAYSMLLARGLIRVGIGIPATAEFELDRGRGPVRLRQRRGAVALPPAAAVDQPALPERP